MKARNPVKRPLHQPEEEVVRARGRIVVMECNQEGSFKRSVKPEPKGFGRQIAAP